MAIPSESLHGKFLRFGGVGLLTSSSGALLLYLLVNWANVGYLAGYTLIFLLLNTVAFFLNCRFSFRAPNVGAAAYFRYLFVSLFGLGANLLLMMLLVEVLGLNYIVACFAVAGLVAAMSFVGHLCYSFGSR